MLEILIRAGCYIAIIVLGFVLRATGYFKEEDFKTLSKIVIKITLPAAIISNFSGTRIDPSMLSIVVLSIGCGLVYIAMGWLLNHRAGKDRQAFDIVNICGYNIGNFTLPFIQGFLGPMGLVTTSLFDAGNACICLGGAFGVASSIKERGGFSVGPVARALVRSIPFDCYVLVTVMNIAGLSMPGPVLTLAQIVGNANAFLAMLMVGVGFKLAGERSQVWSIVRILATRYGVALLLALAAWFLLPFDAEVRKAMVILLFSPISSAAPAFTSELDGDIGLSSAVNSLSVVCSIPVIVGLLMVMQ